MVLTDGQKQLIALLAQRKPDSDYMIRLSDDHDFALSELISNLPDIYIGLLKEKESHESHIVMLTSRLEKISTLLSTIEEIKNGT